MTRSQRRYIDLRAIGFLHEEAMVFRHVGKRRERGKFGRIKVSEYPWLEKMKEDRAQKKRIAKRRGYSKAEFEGNIKRMYHVHDWTRVDSRGRRIIDPYSLLRAYSEAWENDHPGYRSPSDITHNDFDRFSRALNRSLREAGRIT